MNNTKHRSPFAIAARLIVLVRPMLPIMLAAIVMGVIGHFCATFITVFGGFALLTAAGLPSPLAGVGTAFVCILVFALLRGVLRYAEQASNHYIAFKLLALIRDKVFGALRRLTPAKLEGRDRGDLISLITADIEALEVFYAHTISPVCIAVLWAAGVTAFTAHWHILPALALLAGYLLVGAALPVWSAKRGQAVAREYRQALADFFRLCGPTPLLPRYALGNWWSRFHAYTAEEYLSLMDRFEKSGIPLSVAVIDMNWHISSDGSDHKGWTGYTWDKALFPEPAAFLKVLHQKGLRVTLNLHPAEGIQPHEVAYPQAAAAMGRDAARGQRIPFEPENRAFWRVYFDLLHRPLERQGVDFWWIDWQQGSNCKVEGLDPLWIFNHFHYLDNKRDGRRPMTFSRYAGPGSHRYPIGFSGDTHITWESLDFQPYFTTTATNIGYGWWSHDIGGHMLGYKDDELTARWTQYGIFSPIMRLHSSCSEFNGKEPWRFKKETEEAMEAALRQRHCMIPYLYTMNYRSYAENMPLIEPMYYEYPENAEAYEVKNQYFFGSQLMVAPVTTPRIKGLNVARTKVWFPEGIWYDIYTGMRYDGGRMLEVYRDLSSIPVFAKAGGILVCADADELDARSVIKNPDVLCVRVFPEADGEFELYEDDNESCGYVDGRCVTTAMKYSADKDMFVISPADGDTSLIPDNRTYKLVFERRTEAAADKVKVSVDGKEVLAKNKYDKENRKLIVTVNASSASKISVTISKDTVALDNQIEKRCFDFLNQAEIGFVLKDEIYGLITSGKKTTVILSELKAKELDTELYGVLTEILTA